MTPSIIYSQSQKHDGLTLDNVIAHRSGQSIPTGVAAGSSSDMFKSASCASKPQAKRWDAKLSNDTKMRKPAMLKSVAMKYLKQPGMISLSGGLPSSEYFPFDGISVKIPGPPTFGDENDALTTTATKHDIADGKNCTIDLTNALNYSQSMGIPGLLRFVTEHTEIVHNPPYSDWGCALSAGSTSSWEITLRMLCNPGDYILAEEYTFSSAIENAIPVGVRIAPVSMDEQGLIPHALDEVMTNWDVNARGARKPNIIYLIPTGQNPTGSTHSAQRRREVYGVCQKHDLIIVEDEPYYFLQMQEYLGVDTPISPPVAGYDEFLKSLVPSYLSMDVDGRVVRLESFSKVISPGSRTGYIVASNQIITQFLRHSEGSTQNPSGISQLLLYKILEESWGHKGFLDWLKVIQVSYTKRRNSLLEACEKHLPSSIASWRAPSAGMFHWIKIDWTKHPSFKKDMDYHAIENAIFSASAREGALVACGSWFLADSATVGENGQMFFRTTFAAAPADKINDAIARFGLALKKEFELV